MPVEVGRSKVGARLRWLKMLLGLIAALLPLAAPPAAAASALPTPPAVTADSHWGEMPLYFIANQGQMDDRVAYYVQGSDKTLYFTSEGVTFALSDQGASLVQGREKLRTWEELRGTFLPSSVRWSAAEASQWTVELAFVDANEVVPSAGTPTGTVVSYFTGAQDEWQTGLPTYSSVAYADLWEGVYLAYSGTVDRLKHEFVVRPGAHPEQIRLEYRGATVTVNHAGQLEVNTPAGGFTDDAPVAYQEVDGRRVAVEVVYDLALGATEYGFRVGDYDPNLPLVIDPAVLVYCGFIGGNDRASGYGDQGTAIAVDSAGSAYVTGYCNATEATFPVTVGPDLAFNSGDGADYLTDAFVAKVRADGTGLVYCGYIGGYWADHGTGIAVDSYGSAYICGVTESAEDTFPVTGGPDLIWNGGDDAFVAKVNPDGTGLVYCGYIGGSSDDDATGITVDADGDAYVAGTAGSSQSTFPVTVGPDLVGGAMFDAFVAKVNASGTALTYCGYVGGAGVEQGEDVAVDSDGNAYITGITNSTESTFPASGGPDPTYNGGNWDAFVAKVNAAGTGLVYAGYIGGSGDDYGQAVAVDSAANAYVTGYTDSSGDTFPMTGGLDSTFSGGNWDAFVAKANADGASLAYAGYIGGSDADLGLDIAVDSTGVAYITGTTDSNEATFPATGGPDVTLNGYGEAFVAAVKADGSGLGYAGYIGGGSSDGNAVWGAGIAVGAGGNAYVTGTTISTGATFPVLVGPDLTHNGGWDAFVAKVHWDGAVSPPYTSIRGTDRYDTAIRVSKALFPAALPADSGLVVAPGETFPEALCGAPLAAAYGGPVLLTYKTALANNVKAELQRLAPKYVVCIGLSTAAVTSVQTAVPTATVTAINGAGTSATIVYDMSRKVANALEQRVQTLGGDISGATAIVTRGDMFPDAIGVSPLACSKLWPIILTNKGDGSALHPSATATFTDLGITKALKVGTYAALPAGVAGLSNLSGADRYVTNRNVAQWAKDHAGLLYTHIGLAGDKFPDALASGPYLAADDGILLLSPLIGPLPPVIGAIITANQAAVQHVTFIACIEPVIGQVKALLP